MKMEVEISAKKFEKQSAAQDIFNNVKEEYKVLIRKILQEEREVMHLKRRTDIHQNLLDHIRTVIK